MPKTLTVRDRSTDGRLPYEATLDFLTDRVSVRELIRSRVYQEVQDQKLHPAGSSRGLVQPPDLDGAEGRAELDWTVRYELALKAFEWRQFVVLVDDRQLDDLDAEIEIKPGTVVTFLKLVPLVGG